MLKLLIIALFSSSLFAANSNYTFCKSQLVEKEICEIFMGKKKPRFIKEWIKNIKKTEVKKAQEMEESKKEISLKSAALTEIQKELESANSQITAKAFEYKELKNQYDNLSGQMSHQLAENRRIKKSLDLMVRKHKKFTKDFNLQNRITIVLGILFVLCLFLLIKKAKEAYNFKKEISVLRTKLKEFSVNTDEISFPTSPATTQNTLATQQ